MIILSLQFVNINRARKKEEKGGDRNEAKRPQSIVLYWMSVVIEDRPTMLPAEPGEPQRSAARFKPKEKGRKALGSMLKAQGSMLKAQGCKMQVTHLRFFCSGLNKTPASAPGRQAVTCSGGPPCMEPPSPKQLFPTPGPHPLSTMSTFQLINCQPINSF